MQQENRASGQKDQDNIGYENTKKRNDRDDREMDRVETTDTDNDENKPVNVSFDQDAEDAGDEEEDDDEEKVFGQL